MANAIASAKTWLDEKYQIKNRMSFILFFVLLFLRSADQLRQACHGIVCIFYRCRMDKGRYVQFLNRS